MECGIHSTRSPGLRVANLPPATLRFCDLVFQAKSWKKYSEAVIILLIIIFTAACQSQPNQIFIEVDDARQTLTTEAATVRDALTEADVKLGPLDKVSPDLYVQLEQGMTIAVTRVTEDIETEREIVPFERQTVVNEALPAGETKLAQLGVNGEDEISIRVVYEDGKEISRTEITRVTVHPPVPEIMVIGPQDTLLSVPVEGTIAYLSGGNAWLMRNSSGSRRALTTNGNLDSRVFSLSPDGRRLLYTTSITNEIGLPLNDLWLASTTIVGEKPITLGVQGVLQAQWSPVVTESRIIYTTAERTANAPGWQANNDLRLLDLSPLFANDESEEIVLDPIELLPANTDGLYPWWGTTFVWSPNGAKVAYARADQIGVIDVTAPADVSSTGQITATPLLDFAPLNTFSDWVWVPGLSWSPNSQFLAATVHGPPLASEPEDESQVFDLWLLGAEGGLSVKVAEQVGMWANPAWGQAGIAFGSAVEPLRSVTSRYTLQLIDRDGSNKRRLFPFSTEPGVQLPELAWSPDGEQLLFVYNGNLHITGKNGGVPKQLSTDGQAGHPQWALAQAPIISRTIPITADDTLTGTTAITEAGDVTAIPSPGELLTTPVVTPTGQITVTPSATVAPLPTETLAPTPALTITTTPTVTP